LTLDFAHTGITCWTLEDTSLKRRLQCKRFAGHRCPHQQDVRNDFVTSRHLQRRARGITSTTRLRGNSRKGWRNLGIVRHDLGGHRATLRRGDSHGSAGPLSIEAAVWVVWRDGEMHSVSSTDPYDSIQAKILRGRTARQIEQPAVLFVPGFSHPCVDEMRTLGKRDVIESVPICDGRDRRRLPAVSVRVNVMVAPPAGAPSSSFTMPWRWIWNVVGEPGVGFGTGLGAVDSAPWSPHAGVRSARKSSATTRVMVPLLHG
jgi:hypothetical protein